MMGTRPPGRGGPGVPLWLTAERRPPTREHWLGLVTLTLTRGLPPGFGALALGEEKYWWGPHSTLHTAHETRQRRAPRQPAACSQQPAARKPAGRTHAPRRPSCQPRSPRRFLSLLSIRGRILPLHLLPPNLHLPPRCHTDGVAAYLPALSGLVLSVYRSVAGLVRLAGTRWQGATTSRRRTGSAQAIPFAFVLGSAWK